MPHSFKKDNWKIREQSTAGKNWKGDNIWNNKMTLSEFPIPLYYNLLLKDRLLAGAMTGSENSYKNLQS